MPRMSILVTVLVVLAASATLLAGALFFGFLSVPGGVAASPTRPPGSLATPSATPDSALPSAAPSTSPSTGPTPGPTAGGSHVVQPGESLSTIGELYGVPWLQIAEANGIPEPYTIQVGQQLTIPIAAPPTTEPGIHIVQAGESIISIAEQYGIDATELADANPDILDWNLIFVGQRLTIPDGSQTAVPSATP